MIKNIFLYTCFILFSNCFAIPIIKIGYDNCKYPHKTNYAIQDAINELDEIDGGIIELNKGIFYLHDSISPKTNIIIRGQGKDTLLKKYEQFSFSLLEKPIIKGSKNIFVNDPSKFYVGQGVNIGANDVIRNNTTLTKIEKIEGKKITLKDPILFSCMNKAYIINNFPCIFVLDSKNVKIENLTIDGNRDNTSFIYSWKIGGIRIWNSDRFSAENVEIKNICGDGISVGTSNYVILKNLNVHDTDQIGIHLSTGSKYAILSNCLTSYAGAKDHFNGAGIFICQDIKYSIVRNCISHNNNGGGISIGGNDCFNFIINNHIFDNINGGIRFRVDGGNTCKYNLFAFNLLKNNSPTIAIDKQPDIQFFDDNIFYGYNVNNNMNVFVKNIRNKSLVILLNYIIENHLASYSFFFPSLFKEKFHEIIQESLK